MRADPASLRADAIAIWTAGVEAVKPHRLVPTAVEQLPADVHSAIDDAPRILVVGGGKAGTRMTWYLERALDHHLSKIEGWVNVPAGSESDIYRDTVPAGGRLIGSTETRTHLHPARPAGHNHPTEDGVRGTAEILHLVSSAGPDDVAFCLLSGGGSALLPAPAEGITLADKQAVTKLLHASGATIGEMNAVRKHLSRVKGGRLATAFRGRMLATLVISDVVGDPLDVIASGPTAPDPTTFADALAVLDKFHIRDRVPAAVLTHLVRGADGQEEETAKVLPASVRNVVIGNNTTALTAARRTAESLGYSVLDLGPFVEGETRHVATAVAGIVRNIREREEPVGAPACILIGGETTVTLGASAGKGGRNQEFVLAMLEHLGPTGMKGVCVLSGGTDGEDGPTDAAGGVADENTPSDGASDHLRRHDAYPFFNRVGGLLRIGLTGTNVMDVRVILVR